MAFELRAGDDVVATLAWEKAFGTLALAQTAEQAWTFKRMGFFNTRVTIRASGSEADLGIFKPGWGYSGTLEVGGRAYAWKSMGFLGGKWGFFGPDGTEYVSFQYTGGLGSLLKVEGAVEVLPGAPVGPDLPLLLALGWYLMTMMYVESTTVAV